MKAIIILLTLLSFQAQAKESLLVWLVAPEIWAAETPEQKASIQNLETYLQQSLETPVKIEVQTSPGFSFHQYKNLKNKLATVQPNYIFYIESSRLLAKDLEEALHSNIMPNMPLSLETLPEEEKQNYQNSWTKILPNWEVFKATKEASFLQSRMASFQKAENAPTDEQELYMNISLMAFPAIQNILNNKFRVVFLMSPERIRYSREIFPDGHISTSIAQMFFQGENLNQATAKENLGYTGLNVVLLPAEYANLGKREYLMENSRWILNSTGVQKSFEIIKPMISSYLTLEKNRIAAEEQAKKAPKVAPAVPKKKDVKKTAVPKASKAKH